MSKLILLRHGESEWNKKKLFTGWVDVPLSPKGIKEAIAAGDTLADTPIDIIFVSTLIRAQMTAMLAMAHHKDERTPIFVGSQREGWDTIHDTEAEKMTIPVYVAWELNERMYGELQGYNKVATAEKYGADQVKIWRRSYDTPPPEGESLKMTAERTLPYFKQEVMPLLVKGNNILISAHGNSLRSIIMELDDLSEEEVLELEIPTGEPRIYHYDTTSGALDREK